MKMKQLCLCLVFLYVSVTEVIYGQEEETAVINEVICNVCSCNQTKIDCSEKDLEASFTEDNWKGISTLQPAHVNLSHNSLTALTRFPSLPIQTLDLSSCDLESIQDGCFTNLEELVWLDLSNNKLSSSKISRRVFAGKVMHARPPQPFTKMRYLSLAYNDIHSLAQDVFNFMTALTTLDLSGNPLTSIDQVTMGAISDLTNLEEFYLSGCELEVLPEGLLRRQTRLQRLDLSNNRFTTVPAVLAEAVNLVFLNIDNNPITTVEYPNAIANLTKLQELHLCHLSKLHSVGANALGGLENLEVLYLCYNPRLTHVDPTFLVWEEEEKEKWPPLKKFYMNNNNISTFDSHILSRWDGLTALDVTSNPYFCDCLVTWVVHTLVPILDGTANNGSQANMICNKPPALKGLTFKYLYESQQTLDCQPTQKLVSAAEADGVILLGVMFGVLVTFPVVLIITILWKKGYFTKCSGNADNRRIYDEETEDL